VIGFEPVRDGDIRRDYQRASAKAPASPCRALVAVSPVKPRESLRPKPAARASAAFLAHLIATAEGMPQTCEKRRLAPEEASQLYAAAQARTQPRRARVAAL
jgi:hypothetical protein